MIGISNEVKKKKTKEIDSELTNKQVNSRKVPLTKEIKQGHMEGQKKITYNKSSNNIILFPMLMRGKKIFLWI